MKIVTYLLLSSLAAVTYADERGQSIMFEDKRNAYEYLTTSPESEHGSLGDHCMEMSRQIEQLKGKPQRRHALQERFRLECQGTQSEIDPALK